MRCRAIRYCLIRCRYGAIQRRADDSVVMMRLLIAARMLLCGHAAVTRIRHYVTLLMMLALCLFDGARLRHARCRRYSCFMPRDAALCYALIRCRIRYATFRLRIMLDATRYATVSLRAR